MSPHQLYNTTWIAFFKELFFRSQLQFLMGGQNRLFPGGGMPQFGVLPSEYMQWVFLYDWDVNGNSQQNKMRKMKEDQKKKEKKKKNKLKELLLLLVNILLCWLKLKWIKRDLMKMMKKRKILIKQKVKKMSSLKKRKINVPL